MLLVGFLPSFLKRWIYRAKGHSIGKGVSFGFGSVIIGKKVTVGDGTSFGHICVVRGTDIEIGRYVTIGTMTMIDTEKVIIGEDTRINENVIIGGIKKPESMFKIGKRGIVMEYSFINPTQPIIIGDDCGIGGHCLLFTHGSWLSQLDGFPVNFAPITFGDRVWLPWRVFVMPGVTIGSEVVIGANSLISKSLPSNVLAAGSPAKVIVDDYPTKLTDEQRSEILSNILDEFVTHLEHNSFKVVCNHKDSVKHYQVSGKGVNSEMAVVTSDRFPTFNCSDNLLVSDSNKEIDGRFAMSMDLHLKQRKGTSAIGEEFAKFISRFGVRLDRLD